MQYLISQFFTTEELNQFKSVIDKCTWEDGVASLDLPNELKINEEEDTRRKHVLKKNLQCWPNTEFFYSVLDNHIDFLDWTRARKSTEPLVTITDVGGYYRPHFDFVENGHFSTTIFMNDPSEYDGGELSLWIKGEEKKIKLEPGWGITYETGTGHCVNEVTRGQRLVCVFWSTSTINNMEDLYAYRYYDMMAKRYPVSLEDRTLQSFMNNDMNIHFREKANKIHRRYL